MFNDSSSSTGHGGRRGSGGLFSKKGRIVRRVSKTLDEEELKNFQLKYAEFTTTPGGAAAASSASVSLSSPAPTITTTTITTPVTNTTSTATPSKPVPATPSMRRNNERQQAGRNGPASSSSSASAVDVTSSSSPVLCYVLNPIRLMLKEPLIVFDFDDLKSLIQKLSLQHYNDDHHKLKPYKEFTTIHAAYEYVQKQKQLYKSVASPPPSSRERKRKSLSSDDLKDDENSSMDVEKDGNDNKDDEKNKAKLDVSKSLQEENKAHLKVVAGISPPPMTGETDNNKSVADMEDTDDNDGKGEDECIDESAAAAMAAEADPTPGTNEASTPPPAASREMDGGGAASSGDGIYDDVAAATTTTSATTSHKQTSNHQDSTKEEKRMEDDVIDDADSDEDKSDEELQDIFKAAYSLKSNNGSRPNDNNCSSSNNGTSGRFDDADEEAKQKGNVEEVTTHNNSTAANSNSSKNSHNTAGLYDDADEDPSEMESEACPQAADDHDTPAGKRDGASDDNDVHASPPRSLQDYQKKAAGASSASPPPSGHEHGQIADIMIAFRQQEKSPRGSEDEQMDSSSPSSDEGEPSSSVARRVQPSCAPVEQQEGKEVEVEWEEPGPYDVLCGKRWEQYSGNVRFRKLILERSLEMYERTSGRSSSGTLFDLATTIVSNVQTHTEHPVRFLKCTNAGHRDTGPWITVEDKEAAWFIYYELLKLRSSNTANNRSKLLSLSSNLTAARLGQGGIPFHAAAGTALRQGLGGGGLLTSSMLGHADLTAMWRARQKLEAAGIAAGAGSVGVGGASNALGLGQDLLRQQRSLAGNPTGALSRSPYSRIGAQAPSARYSDAGLNETSAAAAAAVAATDAELPVPPTHETLSKLSAAFVAKKNAEQQQRRRRSSKSFAKSAEHVKKVKLPEDFTPTPYSVICGRGKKCAEFIGNRRLKVMATMFIARYNQAHTKEDKSVIVSEVLEMVQDACPDKTMAFVRFHGGRWWSEDTSNAREKIGTVLRDCLSDKYNSSTKSKCQRRREKREAAKKGMPPSLKNVPLDQRSCPPK